MDVSDLRAGPSHVKDTVGEQCQKLFQEFLEEWVDDKNVKRYHEEAFMLLKPERDTLSISLTDVERFNQSLCTIITEEYYRVSSNLLPPNYDSMKYNQYSRLS